MLHFTRHCFLHRFYLRPRWKLFTFFSFVSFLRHKLCSQRSQTVLLDVRRRRDVPEVQLVAVGIRLDGELALGPPSLNGLGPQLLRRALDGFETVRLVFHGDGVQVFSAVADLNVAVLVRELGLEALGSGGGLVLGAGQTGVRLVANVSRLVLAASVQRRKQDVGRKRVAAFERI